MTGKIILIVISILVVLIMVVGFFALLCLSYEDQKEEDTVHVPRNITMGKSNKHFKNR